MFTDEERKLFEETIAHWKRMHKWAYTEPTAIDPVYYLRMLNAIGEGFDTGHCPLCRIYRDNFRDHVCGECPLFKEVGQCGKSNDNLYPDTRDKNWSQWTTTAAEKFIKQLQSILDRNTKVEIDWSKPVININTGNTVTHKDCKQIFQPGCPMYIVDLCGRAPISKEQRVKMYPKLYTSLLRKATV